MNRYAVLIFLLPLSVWGNELPPLKMEPKPIKAAQTPASTPSNTKVVSKHAAPQQMTEPIKLLKPIASAASVFSERAVVPEAIKPINPPVDRYTAPQFLPTPPAYRPIVRSKAPRHSAPSKSSASYAIKPGLVRILPASKIPNSAVLPPVKQLQKSRPETANIAWGDAESSPKVAESELPVIGRKIASPKFYIETNSELRWQYYSYP